MSSSLYDHISKRLDHRVSWRSFWPFLENVLALPPSLSCCPVFGFIFPTLAGLSQMWGAAPFVSLAPGMVMWQAVLHFFNPTLNVLSFISQAHYLDRVVKGMVFFLYFPVVFVCVLVYEHNRQKKCVSRNVYIPHKQGVSMLPHPRLCHSSHCPEGGVLVTRWLIYLECHSPLPQVLSLFCDITTVLLSFSPHTQIHPLTLSTPSHVTLPMRYGPWSIRMKMLGARVGGLRQEETPEQTKKS